MCLSEELNLNINIRDKGDRKETCILIIYTGKHLSQNSPHLPSLNEMYQWLFTSPFPLPHLLNRGLRVATMLLSKLFFI